MEVKSRPLLCQADVTLTGYRLQYRVWLILVVNAMGEKHIMHPKATVLQTEGYWMRILKKITQYKAHWNEA